LRSLIATQKARGNQEKGEKTLLNQAQNQSLLRGKKGGGRGTHACTLLRAEAVQEKRKKKREPPECWGFRAQFERKGGVPSLRRSEKRRCGKKRKEMPKPVTRLLTQPARERRKKKKKKRKEGEGRHALGRRSESKRDFVRGERGKGTPRGPTSV